jgi:cytochrome c553
MSTKRSRLAVGVTMFTLVAGVASIGHAPGVPAQAAVVKAGSGDDLRAAFANAAEVAEGKRVAEASCVGCHGPGGVSANKGVPHLAGQRPAYLYRELRIYQTGGRGDAAMGGAVKFLNDDALIKVAAYYASLEPALPGVPGGAKSAPGKPDPIQAGKAAAAPCAGCHGDTGISKTPGVPNLVGLDPKYLVMAMNAYKSGQRKHDAMKAALSAATDADVAAMALFYALQKPARAQTPTTGDAAAGKAATTACTACHGNSGVGTDPATPNLAGQDAQYVAAALRAYKDGSRSDATMKALTSALDDAAGRNLAAFYANQPPQQPKVDRPLTTAEWVQRCDRCHGVDGNSADPRMPALAGQRADYLEKVLHAYRAGERKSPQMAAMSGALTAADVESLAAHYARQKARSVVYVTLPAR